MLPLRGLYEVAVRVKQLSRAETFYKEILGLEEAIRDEERDWLFLLIPERAGMIVLQEDRGEWPRQHFAFTVDEDDLDGAATLLREKGVAVEGPVEHEWPPARSVYFSDPDGHELELYALCK